MFINHTKLNLEYMKKELERVKKEKEKEIEAELAKTQIRIDESKEEQGKESEIEVESESEVDLEAIPIRILNDSSAAPTTAAAKMELEATTTTNSNKKQPKNRISLPKKFQSSRNALTVERKISSTNLRVYFNKQRNIKSMQNINETGSDKESSPLFHPSRASKTHSILTASAQDIKDAQFEKHLLEMQELATTEQMVDLDSDYDWLSPEEDPIPGPRKNKNVKKFKKSVTQQRLKLGGTTAITTGGLQPAQAHMHSTSAGTQTGNLPKFSKSMSNQKPTTHHKIKSASPNLTTSSTHGKINKDNVSGHGNQIHYVEHVSSDTNRSKEKPLLGKTSSNGLKL